MKIKIIPDTGKYVINTNIAKEDFDLLKKYNPDALKIKDEEGNDVFAIGYTEGKSNAASFGVTFGGVDRNGCLVANFDIPAGEDHLQEYVADAIGSVITNLAAIERSIPTTAATVKTNRADLIASIEIV